MRIVIEFPARLDLSIFVKGEFLKGIWEFGIF